MAYHPMGKLVAFQNIYLLQLDSLPKTGSYL